MKKAYQIAQRNAKKTAESGKEYYNKRVFQLGDRVLVRNLTERGGPGKLQSHWELVIHVVADRIGRQSLVQRVKPESGGGRTRMPCNVLELDAPNLGFGTRPRRPTVEKQPLSVSGIELQSSETKR